MSEREAVDPQEFQSAEEAVEAIAAVEARLAWGKAAHDRAARARAWLTASVAYAVAHGWLGGEAGLPALEGEALVPRAALQRCARYADCGCPHGEAVDTLGTDGFHRADGACDREPCGHWPDDMVDCWVEFNAAVAAATKGDTTSNGS